MKFEICAACVFAMIGVFSSCKKTSVPIDEPCTIQTDSIAIASKLLTLSFAEKIMGESGELSCNIFTQKGDTAEYRCDYTALAQDLITGKTGKLYFMLEIYSNLAASKNTYTSIYQANSRHEGVEIVFGLGDEAYYHSDGTNFYFYLVRKNEKLLRLKLNKVTSHSSSAEFKTVTRLIVDKL